MRKFWNDLRHGARLLVRNPGFALTAVLLLALGIGANTAIFSVVNGVLLKPLPYPEASRVMQIWHVPPAKSFPGIPYFSVSPANYLDWKRESKSFEHMAAFGGSGFTVGGGERPEAMDGATVAPEFFSVLRVQPMLGRSFSEEENQPGHGHVVILGNALWRDHFSSDPQIVGRNITLNGEAYNVVGVMDAKFAFPSWAKLWVPLAWTDTTKAVRGNHNYLAIGRLKAGVGVGTAKSELGAISARLEQLYPEDDKGWGATAIPLREQLVGDVRPALLILLGAVGFVLLIACANVANLVLGKILARKKEIAIRTALGASRVAILRQVLAETLLLSVLGALLGLLFANLGIGAITKFFADQLPYSAKITMDGMVLGFTAVLAIVVGVLSGLLPALWFTRTNVDEALKQGQSRGSSDTTGNKTRGALVTAEVALSLLLLIGAGLMVRTLSTLSNVKPGFDPDHLLTMSIPVPANKFATPTAQAAFFERILQAVRATPGVQSAGVVDSLPLSGGSSQPVSIEGQPVLPMADQPEVDVRLISPGYLSTMHVPLLSGRDLTDADVAERTPVAIISESMAKRFWPNENPLGRHLTLTFFPGAAREIVGVVGDVKMDSLQETRPVAAVYWPYNQYFTPPSETWRSHGTNLALRTNGEPTSVVAAVTEAVRQVDSQTPVVDVIGMNDLIAKSLSPQRFNLLLLSAFAGLALVLTAAGIYSVLSYMVRRRFREIGIRMAMGATPKAVLRLVVGEGMKPILLGIMVGLAAAFGLGRVVSSLLYGVSATDPLTFATVSVLLVVVGLLATALPAYRATRVEPVKTLREE